LIELDYRDDLTNCRKLADQLTASGLGDEARWDKAELFAKADAALSRRRGEDGRGTRRAFFVPGRIEVLGKHTDYAGGRSMVAAAERGFCLVASPRRDNHVAVIDAVCNEAAQFTLEPDLTPNAGHWSNYPMTVARRIARNFPGADRGADIALASDLPPAAGMSSSSAMMVAVFLALADVNRLVERTEYRENIHSPTDLAGYLGTVENGQTFGTLEGDRGVGTFGGSEDHTAILTAESNRVSQYSYCPVRFERSIAIPSQYTFVIGVSGIVAEKTGAAREKYNAASRLASAVVKRWCDATGRSDPHLAAVLLSSPDAGEQLKTIIASTRHDEFDPDALLARFEHFRVEHEQVIPTAGDALAGGDLDLFGRLVDRSQEGAERLLGNQVPETASLAAMARRNGAVAASAFGAGFGGGVWALVEKSRTEAFLSAWSEAYRREFPKQASVSGFFVTGAGPAAFRVC